MSRRVPSAARVVIAVCVGVGLFAAVFVPPRAPVPRPGRAESASAIPTEDPTPAPTEIPNPAPAPSPRDAAYQARVADVAGGCGLEAVPRCGEGACVAVMAMPDLDRVTGWLELGMRHPTFVASTVARDLGVPPRTLPCGAAVSALVGEGTVRAVELDDGREVWCASDGDPDEAGALCDGLVQDVLHIDAAARFTDPALRRLEFDRDR